MEQHSVAPQQPMAVNEKAPGQTYQQAVSPGTTSSVPGGEVVYETPMWMTIVRGFQLLLGLIIMVLGGLLIHGVLLNAWAFALVCGLFTWIIVPYIWISEKVPGARGLYNIYAILALDALMVIFWLASMGSNASTRASFKYSVNVLGCYSDGSNIDANTCIVARDLEKRKAAVAGSVALAEMSAIAGLSALQMLLFIATLVFLVMEWNKKRPRKGNPTPGQVEMNNVPQPGVAPNPTYQPTPSPMQQQQQPIMNQPNPQPAYSPSPVSAGGYVQPAMQPQFTGQSQQQQAMPMQPQYTGQSQPGVIQPQYSGNPLPPQPQAPYQQVPTPGPQGAYQPQQQYNQVPQQQQQQQYPSGYVEAPGQPYSPPQELPQPQYQQYPQQH